MNKFDENGDLWIEIDATSIPQGVQSTGVVTLRAGNFGLAAAVTAFNLTAYIRSLRDEAHA